MGLTTKSHFPTFQGPAQAVVPTPTFSGKLTAVAADSINPYTSQGPGAAGAGQTHEDVYGGPAGDPLFANVKCLIKAAGSPGGTTATDLGPLGLTVGLFGDTQLSSTQTKFGTVSFQLDGTGDYIETSFNSEINLTDQDFTVEAWFYMTQAGANDRIFQQRSGTNGNSYSVEVDASSINFLALPQGNGSLLGGTMFSANVSPAPSLNAWHHIVFQRVGDNFAGYLDGVLIFSDTDSRAVHAPGSAPIRLGNSYVGFMDSYRLTVGAARYVDGANNIASFTPPTAAFPESA